MLLEPYCRKSKWQMNFVMGENKIPHGFQTPLPWSAPKYLVNGKSFFSPVNGSLAPLLVKEEALLPPEPDTYALPPVKGSQDSPI